MEEEIKFGQFEAAFESGREGEVSNYDAWLESHGFEPAKVNDEMIREHFHENPAKTVNYDQQLQTVGEFAGHFAAVGGTIHLPTTGVSGVGKTQFRRTVEAALRRVDADFTTGVHKASELGRDVEYESQSGSDDSVTEPRLYLIADKLEETEHAVIVLDDCGEDKRVFESMKRLESAAENVLFITLWTPESWGIRRDEIEAEFTTTKQIKLSGLNESQTETLAERFSEYIGGDQPDKRAINTVTQYSYGVPRLAIHLLVESLRQAFLNDHDPWDRDAVDSAAESMNLKDARERIESLSQTKLRFIKQMLVNSTQNGIRPKRLVELLSRDKSTVSYHLNDLSSLDLVSVEKQGRSARYSVNEFVKPLLQMRLEKEVELNV